MSIHYHRALNPGGRPPSKKNKTAQKREKQRNRLFQSSWSPW